MNARAPLRVVLFGAESTGKSTLAERLAGGGGAPGGLGKRGGGLGFRGV